MKTISLKLPAALDAELAVVARCRRTSKSALVRDAIEAYLAHGRRRRSRTCYELAPDLAGCVDSGRADLASNARHLEGYGRD